MCIKSIGNGSVAASDLVPSQYYIPEWAGHAGIPVFNTCMDEDGGYVAMYSHHPSDFGRSYQISGALWVIGIVRVAGQYDSRGIFRPDDMPRNLNDGGEKAEAFRQQIFAKYVPDHSVNQDFWLGGDTGGWFGPQDDSSWYH